MFKKLIVNRLYLLILIGVLGFLMRLYLASGAYPRIEWDMKSYENMALNMLAGYPDSDCCDHNAGYSVFLALIFFIFGIGNYPVVRLFQVIMDMVVAILIYHTANNYFNRRAALASYTIYALNPLTASYTGMILAETVTLLVVANLIYLLVKKNFIQNKKQWFFTGFTFGILLFIRQSFQIFIAVFALYLAIVLLRKLMRLVFLAIFFLGFIVASGYTLYANYVNFKSISLTPPYNMGFTTLYWNFYNDRYPELIRDYGKLNKTFSEINLEYHTTLYKDIGAFKKKYTILFWQKMKNDWPLFIRNTIRNMIWIWDKDHLFAYSDPFYPMDKWIIRMLNMAAISFYFIGITKFVRNRKWYFIKSPLFVFSLLLFFYITLMFTLVTNESRHSLLYYPLIAFWGGFGLTETIKI